MFPSIPDDYRIFLAARGPYEGFIENDEYIELWPVETLVDQNSAIEIERYAPGFLAFAGNGGGEIYAFDKSGAVFMLPLVGMEPQIAAKISESFSELAALFSGAD